MKLFVIGAIALFSSNLIADEIDSAINMDESNFNESEISDESTETADTSSRNYSPEHPESVSANQIDFIAPPPRVIDDKPFTPDHQTTRVEVEKPGNHNFRTRKAPKDSGVTILFADEEAAEAKRLKKESQLIKKFYQQEALKKKKIVAHKKVKKVAAKKSSKYKRITRR